MTWSVVLPSMLTQAEAISTGTILCCFAELLLLKIEYLRNKVLGNAVLCEISSVLCCVHSTLFSSDVFVIPATDAFQFGREIQ